MSQATSGGPSAYEALRDILGDVNAWLHFAETKNAALVAANFAIATALTAAMSTSSALSPWAAIGMMAVAGTTLVGGIVSLSSFFAKLTPPLSLEDATAASGNILFYGDIAKMPNSYFLDRMRSSIGANGPFLAIESDLASQIRINSSIALAKFHRFNFALRISICGLVLPPLVSIVAEAIV